MEVNFLAAIVAGFLGGSVMSALMTTMKAGKTEMDMALIQGAMFTDDPHCAKMTGLVTRLVMMSALVGSVYALVFATLGVSADNAWWVGAVLGVVHGAMAGAGMAMMPAMHPPMGPQPASAAAGQVHLGGPGLFARNYGAVTPMGVMVSHVIYGLVVGAVYGLLA